MIASLTMVPTIGDVYRSDLLSRYFCFYARKFGLGNKIALYCQCIGKTSFHVSYSFSNIKQLFRSLGIVFIINQ